MNSVDLSSLQSYPASAFRILSRLQAGKFLPADRFWLDPGLVMRAAGMTPDSWQLDLLQSADPRMLLLCSRQVGKSQVAGALALKTAILEDPALILILAPTERQSRELFRTKILPLYRPIKDEFKATRQTTTELELANGSRIVCLPDNEETVRCFSEVALLIVDEASRVSDDLYSTIRPMMSVSRGRLIALSTPFGKLGWFFEAWEGNEPWERVRITAYDCPRITKEFLEEERRTLGTRWFNQEYLTEFVDRIDSVFSQDAIRNAMSDDIQPLFGEKA